MLRFLRLTAACIALASALPASAEEPQPGTTAVPALAPSGGPAAPASATAAPPTRATDLRTLDASAWPEQGPNESLVGTLLRMLLVLGLVIAVIYVTLNYGLRRLMRVAPGQNGLVTVHERVGLEPKKSVYLVEAGGEYLLLGVGEREISVLTHLDRDRTREALERKAQQKAVARPFWDRLAVKPPAKDKAGGDPS